MNTTFRKSFLRDVKKIKSQKVRDGVALTIEAVEVASDLPEIPNLKKLSGYDNYFRIRLGSYRLGIAVVGGTVDFVRCLPRKDLYRYFP